MAKPFYNEGLHVGQITSQNVTKASTGNKQFILGIKILGVPQGDTYVVHQQQYQRSIFWTITEKTVPFVIEKLNLLGFEGTQASQFDPNHPNHVSMVGQQVDLWCRYEQRQDGSTGEKWDVSNGGAEKVYEPLAAKEMRELDALFGKSLPGAGKPASVSPSTTQKTEYDTDPGITDDDIPF